MLASKFMLPISNFSNILCLCDVFRLPLINLRIKSYSVVMSLVSKVSNSQYLDASHNQCMYCIIDSFGSCLVLINLVLSAKTCLIAIYFYQLF